MVYSLTPFFNENDILEIRLETLKDVVDRFIVVEATTTHSGLKKPLYFDHDRFWEWKQSGQLEHHVVDISEPPGLMDNDYRPGHGNEADWAREKHHRRLLGTLGDFKEDDVILLSDVDEIPHPDAVASFRHVCWRSELNELGNILLCRMHVGKLNYRWKAPAHESHSVARIFPAHRLLGGDTEDMRMTHMPPLGPSGWHLSWMQGYGVKLQAFAHQELVPLARPDLAQQGGPLFPGMINQELEWCPLDELPKPVRENPEKYRHLLAPNPRDRQPGIHRDAPVSGAS